MKKEIYNSRYIYPPRPELKTSRDKIDLYDNNTFFAQPKLNGSCCEIYTGKSIHKKGRHNNTLTTFRISDSELIDIFGGDINLIVGEYMNKSKRSETSLFNHKFVIFDQLVLNREYLLGTTFEERMKIILEIYKPIEEDRYLYRLSENIYIVKTFYNNFGGIWDKLTKIDMYEGLVLKKRNGKLKRGMRERNNEKIQLKVRKPTKNYQF